MGDHPDDPDVDMPTVQKGLDIYATYQRLDSSAGVDNATLTREVGGINLRMDPAVLDFQIKRDGNGILLPVAQQNLENIHLDGLYPIILDIQLITDLPGLVGRKKSSPEQKSPELSLIP